ncbi:MAG: YihY/virulence factor BrkB family protein [Bacteroidaceae bacterium]|nr:YihY/virulence factor BrkB family protein [Bacteroidaceae bacterium]MBR6749338.1 YihY/virulence factor BrkB family protein [Bacteroidaceae bacterium]
MNNTSNIASQWNRLILAIRKGWSFVSEDVWKCKSNNVFIHIIKTLNLSVRCFLNEQLQQRAAALTFHSMLSVVPALVVLIAISRGFGFYTALENLLYDSIPAQRSALQYAFTFVDAYMEQMHNGIFVGIGLILLLWALITLLSNIENTFNDLWNVPNRKLARRITDYMAVFILIPILLIASSGMSLFVNTLLDKLPYFSSLGQYIMQFSSYVLAWLLFAATYKLLPNTKVKIKHALVSGIICGTVFNLFQWLYLSGQIWVSKYNAIYGSFAFLPLLMLWMQLSWLICLIGVVLSYSSQNVFNFEFEKDIKHISRNYYENVLAVIMAIILKRRNEGKEPLSCYDLSQHYQLPMPLVTRAVNDLMAVDLVAPTPIGNDFAYIATVDSNILTVGYMMRKIDNYGHQDFVSSLHTQQSAQATLDTIVESYYKEGDKSLVIDLPTPQEIETITH